MKTSQRLIIKFKKDVPEEKRKEIISQNGLRLEKVIEDINMYVVEVPERASQEEEGKLYYIRYPLEDGSGHITVATTRPETMLGDTAVAVHTKEERYKSLVGKKVRLPLVEW